MLKWLQEGLNQTLVCRAELTLWAEMDLSNFQCVFFTKSYQNKTLDKDDMEKSVKIRTGNFHKAISR